MLFCRRAAWAIPVPPRSPERSRGGIAPDFEPNRRDAAEWPAAVTRPASLRYMGFHSTDDGREYDLRVDDETGSRLFTLVIPHEAFAARQARFQDAPDLCFAKLQRALATDGGLGSGGRLVLTAADFQDYRELQTKRSPERKHRRSASGGQ